MLDVIRQMPMPHAWRESNVGARLKRFINRKKLERTYERIECSIETEIMIVERNIVYTGLLKNISRGGALFRPKSFYILERAQDTVALKLAGTEIYGLIMWTNDDGYGIRFEQPMEKDELERLLYLVTEQDGEKQQRISA